MRRTSKYVHWLNDVQEGEPLSVAIAVVISLAFLGLIILGWKIGTTKESVPPMPKKRLRWPEDAPARETKKPDA